MNRIPNLSAGRVMVTTDMHGDWQNFERLYTLFQHHRDRGEADVWVICGDMVHRADAAWEDASYEILEALIGLQAELGSQVVILLLGNHELPHIYDVMFNRANSPLIYNAPLEHSITQHDTAGTGRYPRARFERLLRDLPFYVTTNAGVTLSHAGAPPFSGSAEWLEIIREFDHDALLRLADDKLRAYDLTKLKRNDTYRQQARDFLAVEDVNDARFTNLLRAHILQEEDLFALLWETFFVAHERDNPPAYQRQVSALLANLSHLAPQPQRVLVAGHVLVNHGMQVISPQKLRIASGAHALPYEQAKYLLFDASQPMKDAKTLAEGLRPVWQA